MYIVAVGDASGEGREGLYKFLRVVSMTIPYGLTCMLREEQSTRILSVNFDMLGCVSRVCLHL